MATEPGLGTSERYLIAAARTANRSIAPISLDLRMISGPTLGACPVGNRFHFSGSCSKRKPWRRATQPFMSKAPARPAAHAVPIRRTGRGSPPRTTPRSIAFRKSSSTRNCRACAATETAARPCQARSGLRPRAEFMLIGPKSAEPACPAIPNARWRGDGTACRRSRSRPCESRDPYAATFQSGDGADAFCKQSTLVVMGPCFRRDDVERNYALAAWANSSSSSSSTGENVLSGLVESVIGLRLP